MTKLLEKAFEEAKKLPETEQDLLAAQILEDLEDEALWEEKFAASREKLSELTEKVRASIRAGKRKEMGIDEVQTESPLTEDEQKELNRRISRYIENPDSGISWEAFKATLG